MGAGPHPSPAPETTGPSLLPSSSPLVTSLGAEWIFRQGKILPPASFFKTQSPSNSFDKARKKRAGYFCFLPCPVPPLGLEELIINVPGTH